MKTYIPKPINTSNVKVPQYLVELVETLARNVHENWAMERIKQGWQYGPERNDEQKLHPCLVHFEDLPDAEKRFDVITAMETIKVVMELGFEIEKRK